MSVKPPPGVSHLLNALRSPSKENLACFLLGLVRVPLIGFVRPQIVSIADDHTCVKIARKRRTKNHVNSLYLGSLCIGADVTSAFMSFHHCNAAPVPVIPLFKDLQADFKRLVLTDGYFTVPDGLRVAAAAQRIVEEDVRVNIPLRVYCTPRLPLVLQERESQQGQAEVVSAKDMLKDGGCLDALMAQESELAKRIEEEEEILAKFVMTLSMRRAGRKKK